MHFACGALLVACSAYDAALLESRSQNFTGTDPLRGGAGTLAETSDAGSDASRVAPGGGGSSGAQASGLGSDLSGAGAGVPDCAPGREGDVVCPVICPEVCNGEDDDCDGRIDEGEPYELCTLAGAVTTCVRAQCLIVECAAGFRDCDGDPITGCETAADDPDHCGNCGQACDLPNAVPACEQGRCQAAGCEPHYADCDDNPFDCETATNTLEHCSGCRVACADLVNATPTCERGACEVDQCFVGYGDCNADSSDGCEKALDALQDCGACGTRCDLEGAVEDCGGGVCIAQSCESGYADCDGDPTDGCEALDSAEHCGACNKHCSDGRDQVVSASCEEQGCSIECATGYGDCDGDAATGCETRLTSLGHCGACNRPCAIPHAISSCQTGTCELLRCESGFGNCDGDPANGCETSLQRDQTCGSCDTDCTRGTDPVCSGGVCSDVVCPDPGTADCNQDGLPCEVQLGSDANHCGACGARCEFATATPHASRLDCIEGRCQSTCDPLFGDCNRDFSDGCETPLSGLAHCGACGVGCSIANATETCERGICEVQQCAPDWVDCDGNGTSCETRLGTIQNCTGCGAACDLPSAFEVCIGAAGEHRCAISSCTRAYFMDCDGLAANGCEVDRRSDPAHCGQCGNDCRAHANVASATCSNGACVYTCAAGYGNCNGGPGCETALNTLSSCGSCGVSCASPNGITSCTTGGCVLVGCNPGYDDCDATAQNGCEPLTTLAHCGSCNAPCSITNGSGTCEAGQCEIVSCQLGWDDCDGDPASGCERDVRPPEEDGFGPCSPDAECELATYGGREYFFCATARMWQDARVHCQQQRLGDLVHIDDDAESAFVQAQLAADAWIWTEGMPDGTGGACAVMSAADGTQIERPCTDALPFVCEIQPDLCPDDPAKTSPGICGCGVPDTDSDMDGATDCNDACPADPTKTSPGICGCGVPDTDSDGVPDCAALVDAGSPPPT